jgi:hypothetical protein
VWANGATFDLSEVAMAVQYSGTEQWPGLTVTVSGDGSVTVGDNAFPQQTFHKTARTLTRKELYALLNQFLEIQFFDLPELYHDGAVAAPLDPRPPFSSRFRIRKHHVTMDETFVKLTLKIGDNQKTITSWNREGPPQLQTIAAAITPIAELEPRVNKATPTE